MRIKIRTEGKQFTIPLPHMLLFSPLAARILTSVFNKYVKDTYGKTETDPQDCAVDSTAVPGMPRAAVSYVDMRIFLKKISKTFRIFKGTPMVCVKSAGGDIVEIIF